MDEWKPEAKWEKKPKPEIHRLIKEIVIKEGYCTDGGTRYFVTYKEWNSEKSRGRGPDAEDVYDTIEKIYHMEDDVRNAEILDFLKDKAVGSYTVIRNNE